MKHTTVSITALFAALSAILWVLACGAPPLPQLQLPQVPSAEPPQIQLPSAPELPVQPATPEGGGNCCLRTGAVVKDKCAGSDRCCIGDWEEDECEVNKGYWFFSKEGCAGAC
jgi:hypothetical protein